MREAVATWDKARMEKEKVERILERRRLLETAREQAAEQAQTDEVARTVFLRNGQ